MVTFAAPSVLAGSHVDTWTESGPNAARARWDDALRRFDASTTARH